MASRRELDSKVGRALMQMTRRAEEAQERAARSHGLHPTDFRCICFLQARGTPMSPRDIIAHLGLTSGAGTALLDRLEDAGFTRRLPNPDDRRSVLIHLDTTAAADVLGLYERIQEKYRAATAELSDANLEAIAAYLTRVAQLSEEMNATLYDKAEAGRTDQD